MSRLLAVIAVLLFGASLSAQTDKEPAIASLIKKLRSPSFQSRDEATRMLYERPEAEAALREALRGADAETRRRIALILEHFERRPLHELEQLVKAGRLDQVIQRVADWPAGRFEDELWSIMRSLVNTLDKLFVEQSGTTDTWNPNEQLLRRPLVLKQSRVVDSTEGDKEQVYFIRAHEILLGRPPTEAMAYNNLFEKFSYPVVSGGARFYSCTPRIVFAGKDIHARTAMLRRAIIMSGGDILVEACEVCSSLIIARGTVTMKIPVILENNIIIAGKSVKCKTTRPNIIRENEPNPLGYIRWSDEPKAKAGPKGK